MRSPPAGNKCKCDRQRGGEGNSENYEIEKIAEASGLCAFRLESGLNKCLIGFIMVLICF